MGIICNCVDTTTYEWLKCFDKIFIAHREARVCSFQNATARGYTFLSSVTNLKDIAGEYIFYSSDNFPNHLKQILGKCVVCL